jgi:RNA polymerase sigma-70 factor (ECF subfamily)
MTRTELLTRIRERIVAYGTSRVGQESAEDLAQETLMLLENKYAHLDQEGDLLPVAIRTMSFKMKSFRRGVGRQRLSDKPADEMPIADGRPNASEELERKEFKKRFELSLEKLGDRCRRLLLLKLEGHRLTAIREMLGAANMQQVYTWDFRCRQDLRQQLGVGATPGVQV